MASARHDDIDDARTGSMRHPPPRSRAQCVLGWATAGAILLGGMNALVQMLRLALGH